MWRQSFRHRFIPSNWGAEDDYIAGLDDSWMVCIWGLDSLQWLLASSGSGIGAVLGASFKPLSVFSCGPGPECLPVALGFCQQWHKLLFCWLSCCFPLTHCAAWVCGRTFSAVETRSLLWLVSFPFGHRPLCPLWGECCWGRHWLHSYGPGLPCGVLHLHDVQQQAEGTAFLRSGEESLLWTLLYCKYLCLFALCF